MANHFYAYISRMRCVKRWALMRNTEEENIQEHSHMVAVLAHSLALIRTRVYGIPTDANAVAVAALYHDATEILTGRNLGADRADAVRADVNAALSITAASLALFAAVLALLGETMLGWFLPSNCVGSSAFFRTGHGLYPDFPRSMMKLAFMCWFHHFSSTYRR